MFIYSIGLTYTKDHDNNYLTNHYYVTALNGCLAVDKALTLFLEENGLNFDDDIDNIEWSYCPTRRISSKKGKRLSKINLFC